MAKKLLESVEQEQLKIQQDIDVCNQTIAELKRKKNKLMTLRIAASIFTAVSANVGMHNLLPDPYVSNYSEKIIVSNQEPVISEFTGTFSEKNKNQLIEVSDWKKIDSYWEQTTTTYTLDDLAKKEFDEISIGDDIDSSKIKNVKITKVKIKEEPVNKAGFKYLKVYYKDSEIYDYYDDLSLLANGELSLLILSVACGMSIYALMSSSGTKICQIKGDIGFQETMLKELKKQKELNLIKK